LAAEARIAGRFGCPVQAGGGTPAGAEAAAKRLVAQGATALVSFGLAGGLDPMLRPGTLIVPSDVLSDGATLATDPPLAACFGGHTGHMMLAGATVVAEAAAKRRLFGVTHAHAIDLESGPVARIAQAYEIPFVVVRAICDPAERDLPPAALVALGPDGKIRLLPVMRSLMSQPDQIIGLLKLARDAARARRALAKVSEHFAAP
jgi:adenosylhomocysteine nucleosidase